MTRRIVLVHYTPPGVVGGVEHILLQYVRELNARGFDVSIVAGQAGPGECSVHVVPELHVASEENVELENELAAGVVSPRFWAMRTRIRAQLEPLLRDAHRVIVHNAFTLHFSLPLTSVLWELAGTVLNGRVLAWSHDLSWTNSLYVPWMHDAYPWNLLREPAPGTRYITVSEERRTELSRLWGDSSTDISVVPNGIDVRSFLRLSPVAVDIVNAFRLFDRDLVLLLPVRITRRKNVELGIRALRSLVERGVDAVFLISGPQAPHHPARSRSYLEELGALSAELEIDDRVIFLARERQENLPPEVIPELYEVADALLFPSQSEGFGLPILEAGLSRLPVIVSDIPVFHEVAGNDAHYVDLKSDPDTIAGTILEALEAPQSRLYRRVLLDYSWDRIIDKRVMPLLGDERVGKVEGNLWTSRIE
jgi:glycosyltransferase involved in cell wall biosynthesis